MAANRLIRTGIVLLAVQACSGAPTRPVFRIEPRPSAASQDDPEQRPAPWRPPQTFDCLVQDVIQPHDVAWQVRTRHDAVASFRLFQGRVSAWLVGGPPRHEDYPMAFVQVENEAMVLHGVVRHEDLRLVVTEPLVIQDAFVADGKTDRRVLAVDESGVFLDFVFADAFATSEVVACERVGLSRRAFDLDGHLAPPRREEALRSDASLVTKTNEVSASNLSAGVWAAQPRGMVVTVRGREPNRTLVSARICGGLVYGTVADVDLLGTVQTWQGSSLRCADTGETHFATEPELTDPWTCDVDVPVFVRTRTLEDEAGWIRRGARFRVLEQETRTSVVTVAHAPVRLLRGARFTVRTSSLASCSRSTASGMPTEGASQNVPLTCRYNGLAARNTLRHNSPGNSHRTIAGEVGHPNVR